MTISPVCNLSGINSGCTATYYNHGGSLWGNFAFADGSVKKRKYGTLFGTSLNDAWKIQ